MVLGPQRDFQYLIWSDPCFVPACHRSRCCGICLGGMGRWGGWGQCAWGLGKWASETTLLLATICQNTSASCLPLPGLELSPVISRHQRPSPVLGHRRGLCQKPASGKAPGEGYRLLTCGHQAQGFISVTSLMSCAALGHSLPLSGHYLRNEGRGPDDLQGPCKCPTGKLGI